MTVIFRLSVKGSGLRFKTLVMTPSIRGEESRRQPEYVA